MLIMLIILGYDHILRNVPPHLSSLSLWQFTFIARAHFPAIVLSLYSTDESESDTRSKSESVFLLESVLAREQKLD